MNFSIKVVITQVINLLPKYLNITKVDILKF
jgi:hypothetical protein